MPKLTKMIIIVYTWCVFVGINELGVLISKMLLSIFQFSAQLVINGFNNFKI